MEIEPKKAYVLQSGSGHRDDAIFAVAGPGAEAFKGCCFFRQEAGDIASLVNQFRILRKLCEELDRELDGVKIPATAASIVNAIRFQLKSS